MRSSWTSCAWAGHACSLTRHGSSPGAACRPTTNARLARARAAVPTMMRRRRMRTGSRPSARRCRASTRSARLGSCADARVTIASIQRGARLRDRFAERDAEAVLIGGGRERLSPAPCTAAFPRAPRLASFSTARPKSTTRTRPSLPTIALSGLKSRWTSPASCAAARPRPGLPIRVDDVAPSAGLVDPRRAASSPRTSSITM